MPKKEKKINTCGWQMCAFVFCTFGFYSEDISNKKNSNVFLKT